VTTVVRKFGPANASLAYAFTFLNDLTLAYSGIKSFAVRIVGQQTVALDKRYEPKVIREATQCREHFEQYIAIHFFMNKVVLIIIALLLATGAIMYVYNPLADSIFWGYPLFFLLAKLMAIIMLLAHGNFYQTSYFKITIAFIGVLILGSLFKILHITRADILLALGAFGIPSAYFFYFLTKDTRMVIDYVKLLAVILTFIPAAFVVLDILNRDVDLFFQMIGNMLVWIIFLHFVVTAFNYKDFLKKLKH
jgi:hypothetical protein